MPIPETTSSSSGERLPNQLPVPSEARGLQPSGVSAVQPIPEQRLAVTATVPSLDAVGLLKALRRRWLVGGTCGVVAALLVGIVVWFMVPPGLHVAYAKMHMPKKPEGVLFAHPEDFHEFQTFQQTQVALMKSRWVLNTALKNPKAVKLNLDAVRKNLTPVEWLEKELRVAFPDGPELPQLSLRGNDPEMLKVLLAAVVDAYMQEVVEKQTKRRTERLDQLNTIATTYHDRLKRITNKRNELAKAIGANDNRVIVLKQELAQKQLARAQAELLNVDEELRRMELEVKTAQANASIPPVEVPDSLVETAINKELEKDVALRAQAEVKLAQARRSWADEHPIVQNLLEDIAARNQRIEAQRKDLRPRYKTELAEKTRSVSQLRLVELNQKIRFYKEYKNLLSNEIERLDTDAQVLNRNSLDLDGFKIDTQLAEGGVTQVLGAIDRLTVELPDPPRVAPLDREEPVIVVAPDDKTRKLMMAGMGSAGTLGLVLFLFAWLEFRSQRIDSFDQVGPGLGLRLMGTLPAPGALGDHFARASLTIRSGKRCWRIRSLRFAPCYCRHCGRMDCVW